MERRWSREQARQRRVAVAWVVVACGAAAAVVLVDAAPTAVPAVDGIYRGLYVLLVGLACSFARRWTWPILAGGALLGGPVGTDAWIGATALFVAAASQLDRRRRQPMGAVVGVLAALVLLRLPPTLAFGVPSLIAAATPIPAVVSAVVAARSKTRSRVLIAVGSTAAIGLAVAVVFAVGMLHIRSDTNRGLSMARTGLAALHAGDGDAATGALDGAASSFGDANRTATAWWMSPTRLVPVFSQHVDLARVLTDEALALAEMSARAAPAVSLDGLSTDDGHFQLDRIAELEPLASEIVEVLTSGQESLAAAAATWLTPPMAEAADRLQEEIAGSLPDAVTAAESLSLAPVLLGRDEVKNYVVLFGNPAEAREMGGFVASMGLLGADDGALHFESLDDPGELGRRLRQGSPELTVDLPQGIIGAQPKKFVRSWTDSPHIDTVRAVTAELFPAISGGTTVDGVLYVDPYVLAALLELTGPVTLPGTATEVNSTNAVDFMLRGQYLSEDFTAGGARKERLGEAGEIAFERLTSGGLPHPRRLADTLSPLVRAHRLLFSTVDPTAHDLLERVGLRPAITRDGDETLLVAHGNRRANKLDAYLERDITYDAEIDEHGNTVATVRVALTNTAPERGLVAYQMTQSAPGTAAVPATTNVLTLEVYSAFDATDVRVDGETTPYNDLPAYGLNQYSIPVSVPAGSTAVVDIQMTGTVDPASCRFTFVPNAGSMQDRFRSSIVTPEATATTDTQMLDERVSSMCGSG